MAKAGRKRSYEAYKRDYKAKQKQLAANGVEMNERLYSEAEFNSQYNRLLNQRKEEVAQGKRKTTGNIVRTLIDKQAFSLSVKQADALRRSRPDIGYYQARSGIAIDVAYHNFKDEWEREHPDKADLAAAMAKDYISTEYFGSP